jgi:hypothetical protein
MEVICCFCMKPIERDREWIDMSLVYRGIQFDAEIQNAYSHWRCFRHKVHHKFPVLPTGDGQVGSGRDKPRVAPPMRPGQTTPNDFELAILKRVALQNPSIPKSIQQLHVLSRDFTGVGCFARFKCDESKPGSSVRHVSLTELINMPSVPNGMGAVLVCKGDQPECLEIFTFGDGHWDGTYNGFSIEPTP